ncbi:MAG: glycosyltransferase family 2 protein [Candidatus Parcubacteria bacterium]|nr:glycosyltransferase family 2 protein [Candidatus Parcubacteria bacterium]
MNGKNTLSVVVSVFNGEKVLQDCLKSVSFADEIILIDNSSTDRTVEIARKYTDKIFTRPNNLMLNVNKNFGFSKASSEWILSLDADERVTLELQREILSTIDHKQSADNGYWIPRKNIIFGKWIEHAGWYPDPQLRLFKKQKGKFPEEHVHEMVKVEGEIGRLRENILHYNYDSISQFLQKLGTIYGPNEAEQLIKKGYIFNWKDAIRFPVKEFLSRFFAREGYKDGFHGLMLSLLMAFYHLIVFSYIWEKLKFKQIDNKEILLETEKEMVQSSKDIFFWFSKEKMKLIKNPLKQIFHRITRKVKS